MKRRYSQSAFLIVVILIIAAYVQGCGGTNTPVPPPAPPAAQPQPIILGNLGAPSPGNVWLRLDPQGREEVLQAIRFALVASGNATVRNNEQFQMTYGATFNRPAGQVVITPLSEPIPEKSQVASLFIIGRSGSQGISIDLVNREQDARVYMLVPAVEIAGATIYTTDQVALFRTFDDRGMMGLIKVPFRTRNPVAYSFLIDPFQLPLRERREAYLNVVERVLLMRFNYMQ